MQLFLAASDFTMWPIPVCAQAMRSRLDLIMGMAYFWTGVGLVYRLKAMLPMIISPRSTSWNYTAQSSALLETVEECNTGAYLRQAYTFNVVRAVVSGGLNRNVIISLKVNPSITAREQLATQEQTLRFIKNEQHSWKPISLLESNGSKQIWTLIGNQTWNKAGNIQERQFIFNRFSVPCVEQASYHSLFKAFITRRWFRPVSIISGLLHPAAVSSSTPKSSVLKPKNICANLISYVSWLEVKGAIMKRHWI